jgi:hypothetical protein
MLKAAHARGDNAVSTLHFLFALPNTRAAVLWTNVDKMLSILSSHTIAALAGTSIKTVTTKSTVDLHDADEATSAAAAPLNCQRGES